jgi:hypothetical protein
MMQSDSVLRAQALAAYECIPSLDDYGELTRLILAEVSLLTEKYRLVRRHDIPHIKELSGLLDVFWQEVETNLASAVKGEPQPPAPAPAENRALFRSNAPHPGITAEDAATHKPVFHTADFADR